MQMGDDGRLLCNDKVYIRSSGHMLRRQIYDPLAVQ